MLGLTTEQNSTTFPTHEETSHNSKRERERERERERGEREREREI